ncbi:MAG TPA: chromate transporter, partial [Solirubrobacterales bacterium]|nr:chromate transporter [Solirubrobacterales bacterium]
TQLAIFSAWRVAGPVGAIVGGTAFIAPGLVVILALSGLFLAAAPPAWVLGTAAGMGAAVAAVAVRAGTDLIPPSLRRSPSRHRFVLYLLLGGGAAAALGPWLVLVLVGSGLAEVLCSRSGGSRHLGVHVWPIVALVAGGTGGVTALAWVALKVGALSYGGGFVIIPLMQGDAVHTYHWMTNAEFLNAVALGQVTPGPVVATIAAVGYAAHGVGGALLAAAVAFIPSFSFILLGGGRFERLRANADARAFLDGAGPAAIGAILGAAIPLSGALSETWQALVLAAAALSLLALRRGIVPTLLAAGSVGVLIALAGGPLPA